MYTSNKQITKKLFKIVDSYGKQLVTAFYYDKDNHLIDSFYWEFFSNNLDEYADWIKQTWQENGVEIIIEKLYKTTKSKY